MTKTFKLVYTDTTSASQSNSVESLFTLKYTNACEDNTLILTEDFVDPVYQLDSGVQTIGTMNVAQSSIDATCDI